MIRKVKKWLFVNLANFITTTRLIFSVWLATLAISNGHLLLMFVLALFCGFSDMADGWVARHYKIESQIGGFIDRLADKLFICPIVFIFARRYLPKNEIGFVSKSFFKGLVAIVILLELLLVAGGVFNLFKGIDISSNKWGKRKMVLQSIAVAVIFLSLILEGYFKIRAFFVSIYLVDLLLSFAVGLAVKSLEGYWQRYQSYQKNPG